MNDILKQNIINTLGIDVLPQAEQEEALETMGRIIFQAVLIRVVEELKDEDKDEFEKVLENAQGNEDALFNFLKAKLPDLDSIVEEEVAKFKQANVDFMKATTKKI